MPVRILRLANKSMFFFVPEFLIFLAGLTKLHPPFPDRVTLVQLAQPNRTIGRFHLLRNKISRLSATKFHLVRTNFI